jgi:hypothetical protein
MLQGMTGFDAASRFGGQLAGKSACPARGGVRAIQCLEAPVLGRQAVGRHLACGPDRADAGDGPPPGGRAFDWRRRDSHGSIPAVLP